MVAAVVTKFHFDSLRTARQRQQLMTETDAEYRNIGFEEFLDGGNGVIARGRVARTVGEEDAVWILFSTSSAEVCAGTMVRRQPLSTSIRRMLRLAPKS